MGLEHELEEIIEDGGAKAIVKGVDKLLNQHEFQEAVQKAMLEMGIILTNSLAEGITIAAQNIINKNLDMLMKKLMSPAFQKTISSSIENTISSGIENGIVNSVDFLIKRSSLEKTQEMIITIIRNKFGTISIKEIKIIKSISDFTILTYIMEKIVIVDNIDEIIEYIHSLI
jgi:hypothetical protein